MLLLITAEIPIIGVLKKFSFLKKEQTKEMHKLIFH